MGVRFQYLICTRSTLHALPFGVSTGRGEGRVARRHARAETGDRGVAAVWQQCLVFAGAPDALDRALFLIRAAVFCQRWDAALPSMPRVSKGSMTAPPDWARPASEKHGTCSLRTIGPGAGEREFSLQ